MTKFALLSLEAFCSGVIIAAAASGIIWWLSADVDGKANH